MKPASRPAEDGLQTFQRVTKIVYFSLLATVGLYWVILETVFAAVEERDLGIVKTVRLRTGGATAAGALYARLSLITPLLADPAAEPARSLVALRTYHILSFALSEAVALYGFVLRVLGASRAEVSPFFVAALFLFLLCFPRAPGRLSGSGR